MRARLVLPLVLMIFSQTVSVAASKLLQDFIIAPNGTRHVIHDFDSIIGPHELIVYTPDFGGTTATVDAVVEMIVVDDLVVEIRPFAHNNTPIPRDGYVVSALGSAATWLRTQFRAGEQVAIARNQLVGEAVSARHKLHAMGPHVTRGANQLVIYTPGQESTGTNPWGIEAVVRDGVVVSVGGNNNPIPEDGFVLSAHGTARDWLAAGVRVGTVVEVYEDELVLTFDSRSLLIEAETYLAQAQDGLETAAVLGMPIDAARVTRGMEAAADLLRQAKELHNAGSENDAMQSAALAVEQARKAALATLPSQPVAVRGAWHRQVELSPAHVTATLDRLARSGINVLFLETFYRGRTLYPSDLVSQHSEFWRWDPVEVWATEAKKFGIDLHLWIHTFRFDDAITGTFLRQHPEWVASNLSTSVPQLFRANQASVDPAHPEARAFVLSLIEEMTTRYDVAGLHLDYIRYPKSDADPSLFTVTDFSRLLYMEETGVDPLDLVNSTDSSEWQAWQEWQEEQITSFVGEVYGLVQERRPGLVLSAAVVGELGEARYVTRQNWVDWAELGYVDLLLPMLYNPDSSWVGRATKAAGQHVAGKALITAGIGPYLGFTPEILVEQVLAAQSSRSFGAAHFALSSLRGRHFASLAPGLYAEPAVPPYRTAEALQVLGSAMLQSGDRVGGPDELLDLGNALAGYGTEDRSAELLPMIEAVQAQAGSELTPWQATLLEQASAILLVAER